ncbi:zinc finger protein 518A [Mantella aurantiaca]
MMRSPSKDFFMDAEESTSSKGGLWDYGRNAFVTSQPNNDSSLFSINERVVHGTETNSVHPVNQAGESIRLNDTGELLSKSPCKKQTARKSVGKGSVDNLGNSEEQNPEIKLEPNLDDDSANISAKVLHFFCQKCKNGIRYSPNDLQKHFLICHNGELPLYPCEMCNFSASDFQEFKQHRKTHRSALVKCEICNNDYLYTLLGLTKHFSVAHCVNGHFSCSKCRFTTRDVGTFVQHIHRHNGIEYACQKCNHISYSKAEFQRHLQGHSTMLPFSCQYCNYSAMRKDFIVKHILAKHAEHVHSRDEHIVDSANTQMVQTNLGQKHVLKKCPTDTQDKSLWRQEGTEKSVESIERSNSFHFKSSDKEQALKDFWVNVNSEQPLNEGMTSVTTINCNKEDSNTQGSLGLLQNIVHGPTVLMVKNNKITVPANYSATFVGYKMVNGKQNLVIKLLPSNKQSTSTPQPSPQSSNNLPRSSHSTNHGQYGASNTITDNRLTPSFKPPSMQNSVPGTPVEKQLASMQATTSALVTRKNESVSRLGTLNRPPPFETPHKNVHSFNATTSSASAIGKKIKEEPEEYNINEKQFFDNDHNHNHETSKDQIQSSASAASRFIDPTTGFLYRSQHSSESSGMSSTATMYSKDLNSSLLHSSTASGLGNFSYSSFANKNAFGMRGIQFNDRFPRPAEMNKNNAPFMPRITSVFSLQSRMPDPKPFGKNTYLHNILQDNKRINDKVCLTKTSGPLTGNNASFGKQPLNSPVPRFDSRIPNGNVPSAVFLKQEPDSSGSGIKTSFPMRVSELLKTHSDSIVNQQLSKDRVGTTAKPSGPAAYHLLRTPQVSGMPQSNTVLYPSGSNRFQLPVLPNNQPGVRMITSQTSAPNTATFNTSNRINAPVMLNTKPGMVLTIANGPFGTIRNVTNVNNGSSQIMGAVNSIGKMPLPRLQRPPVPHVLKPDLGSSSNNLSANILSGSSMGSKLPINLNVLQYCVNSDGSRGTTGSMEGNKQPQSMQKQPLYALLPDGKQAVLLNYVLPNSAAVANAQKTVHVNQVSRTLLPKKPEEVQQATLLRNGNRINTMSELSVKEEDASAFDGYGKAPASTIHMQSKPAEQKHCLRSNSSSASIEEHLSPESDDRTVSQPSMSTSKVPKPKIKQNSLNTSISKNRSCKRRVSDSSSYEADFEFKTKKRVTESILQEVPRKQMLHRKCKAKSYTSEVESPPEMPSPTPTPSPSPPPLTEPTKDVVRTLRLFPVSADQLIKYPQRDQPVVVLNHPDADVPEVINVMRTISKFNGHVLKVSLSKRTLEALLEARLLSSMDGSRRRSKPVSPVKERFVLKLTLKKTSKNNYKIVKNTPTDQLQAKFNCWFCGRVFDNQDEWVGHGQRHLMEATKDWNTLF